MKEPKGASVKPGPRKMHVIWSAAFSVVGLASWQGLVWSRTKGDHDLVGLFAFVCVVCLIAATQIIARPLVK